MSDIPVDTKRGLLDAADMQPVWTHHMSMQGPADSTPPKETGPLPGLPKLILDAVKAEVERQSHLPHCPPSASDSGAAQPPREAVQHPPANAGGVQPPSDAAPGRPTHDAGGSQQVTSYGGVQPGKDAGPTDQGTGNGGVQTGKDGGSTHQVTGPGGIQAGRDAGVVHSGRDKDAHQSPPGPAGAKTGQEKEAGYNRHQETKPAQILPPLHIDGADHQVSKPQRPGDAHLGKPKDFDYSVPGMVVKMPDNLDPNKPVNLLVYNHGLGSTAKSAVQETDMQEQMKHAPPNTVLIVPEWQSSPGSRSSAEGAFGSNNYFDHKVDEVFAKIPGLQGKTAKDIGNIDIISHSAGYKPSEAELYHNKLADKVRSITLLDSLYDNTGFDKWINNNIHDLANGTKRFTNIYEGTQGNSLAQAHRIQSMLKQAGLPQNNFYLENGNPNRVVGASELASHSIFFKHSTATVGKLGPHMSLPNIYVNVVNDALRQER